jgi:hypothetical protein
VAVTIPRWTPSTDVSPQEKLLLKRCQKKRKLFAFLRENRSRLFDDALQDELAEMYRDTGAGKDASPPAMMAMALILQGYLGLSDADAVEATVVDLRWQMVLDRLGETSPAFSQGALFEFRERLIAYDMDRRLLERTAALARSSKGFDAKKIPKSLRIAVDSSPLEGAGRVEDTINLIGHAARKVVKCAAQLLGSSFEDVCKEAGIPLLRASSIKKALDRDWSDAAQKGEAVDVLARQVLSLERWLTEELSEEIDRPPLSDVLAVLRQLMDQDLEPDPGGSGGMRIKQGVAEDRRISVEEGEMRHGRKSKSKRIDGYKRHVAIDLESTCVLACLVQPANRPEHEALPVLKADIDAQGIHVVEGHFDRGYMGSSAVDELAELGATILCKPWRTSNGSFFAKEDFQLDLRAKTITCPAGQTQSITFGQIAKFEAETCDACPIRAQCTSAAPGNGRSVSILHNERLQKRLRRLSQTASGREKFRERVRVEHSLAHIGQRQGPVARYGGARKNTFDMRRSAIIQNLEITHRRAA